MDVPHFEFVEPPDSVHAPLRIDKELEEVRFDWGRPLFQEKDLEELLEMVEHSGNVG